MRLLKWNRTMYNMENLFGKDFGENTRSKR